MVTHKASNPSSVMNVFKRAAISSALSSLPVSAIPGLVFNEIPDERRYNVNVEKPAFF